jgi:hypothetical protein
MKRLKYVLSVSFLALSLTGCSTPTQNDSFFHTHNPEVAVKKPESVQILSTIPAKGSYVLLGQISTSEYSASGIKRQLATIHLLLQRHAANLGGNAIMNIRQKHNTVIADVILV